MNATKSDCLGNDFKICSSFEVDTATSSQFILYFQPIAPNVKTKVDWGDGTIDARWCDYVDGYAIVHNYRNPPIDGRNVYTIRISDTITWFHTGWGAKSRNPGYRNVVRVISWGDNINIATGAFKNCDRITGPVPPWGKKMVSALEAYYNCNQMVGPIPPWPKSMQNTQSAYAGCGKLTGPIPEWGENCTNARETYLNCSNLTGPIPSWGKNIQQCNRTYEGCGKLTGPIPVWGESVVECPNTYKYCHQLTGSVPPWTETIKYSVYGVYRGCYNLTGSVPEWPQNSELTSVGQAYYNCYSLTGTIPEWPRSITYTNECYRHCSNLSGIWNPNATDEEIMPPQITSYANTVADTTDNLRSYFTTAWGGTKTT